MYMLIEITSPSFPILQFPFFASYTSKLNIKRRSLLHRAWPSSYMQKARAERCGTRTLCSVFTAPLSCTMHASLKIVQCKSKTPNLREQVATCIERFPFFGINRPYSLEQRGEANLKHKDLGSSSFTVTETHKQFGVLDV